MATRRARGGAGGGAVTDVDRGYDRFKRGMRKRGGPVLLVGIQGKEAQADHGGITTVRVAVINEFGNPSNTFKGRPAPIPSRPFMRGTFDEKHRSWESDLKKLVAAQAHKPDRFSLGRLGARIQADIQNAISAGVGAPPSPTTLAMRRRQGTPSSKQLIVYGQLKNAITWKVEGE